MEGCLPVSDPLDARQFQIAVKRLADTLSYGTDHSPFLGAGIEYVQSRQYQWGDPVKSIDWRVTARTGKFFVKQYESPKRLPCILLFDTSASMTIQSGRKSKYGVALHIAGGLALACLERISPVGVIAVGGRRLRVEPSLSKDQVMQWLFQLRRFRYDEPTALGRQVVRLAPTLKHRCLLIVLSDMHDPHALAALKRVAQQHDVVVLQFRDPAERHLRGSGFMRTREAETGAASVTHGRHQWLDQEALQQNLRRAGIDHLLVDVDQPFVYRLRTFFESRDLLGRGPR